MLNLINYFSKTLQILEKKFTHKIFFLIFLSLISGFIEIISIGLLLPILSVLIDNNFYKYINYFPIINNFNEINILKFLLLFFFVIYFLKFISLVFIIYFQNKFIN